MEEKEKTKTSLLSKLNLIFLVIVIAGFGFHVVETKKSNKNLRRQISELRYSVAQSKAKDIEIDESIKEIRAKSQVVDFTISSIQDLDRGFMLSSAAESEHLTGIKFTGRIINTQSVKHKSVTFKITVLSVSKEFTINQISSGNSTKFSVYIPDIKAEKARYAKIEYIRSSVTFYVK